MSELRKESPPQSVMASESAGPVSTAPNPPAAQERARSLPVEIAKQVAAIFGILTLCPVIAVGFLIAVVGMSEEGAIYWLVMLAGFLIIAVAIYGIRLLSHTGEEFWNRPVRAPASRRVTGSPGDRANPSDLGSIRSARPSGMSVEPPPLSPTEVWALRRARYLGAAIPTLAGCVAVLLWREQIGFWDLIVAAAFVLAFPAASIWFVGSSALPRMILSAMVYPYGSESTDDAIAMGSIDPWVKWRARTWRGGVSEGLMSVAICGIAWFFFHILVSNADVDARHQSRSQPLPGQVLHESLDNFKRRTKPFEPASPTAPDRVRPETTRKTLWKKDPGQSLSVP